MNPTHTNLHDHAPAFHDLFDLLTKHGTDAMAHAFAATLNIAMRLEREQHLDAGEFQRSANRTGYANGYKPKQMDTPAGRVTVQVPKTRPLPGQTDDYESFFPQALSRGTRALPGRQRHPRRHVRRRRLMMSAGIASPVFFFRPACPINAPVRECVRLSIRLVYFTNKIRLITLPQQPAVGCDILLCDPLIGEFFIAQSPRS